MLNLRRLAEPSGEPRTVVVVGTEIKGSIQEARAHIRKTQQALLFANRNDAAFSKLPPAYVVGNVDEYTRDSLPIIADRSLVEFASDAFSLPSVQPVSIVKLW